MNWDAQARQGARRGSMATKTVRQVVSEDCWGFRVPRALAWRSGTRHGWLCLLKYTEVELKRTRNFQLPDATKDPTWQYLARMVEDWRGWLAPEAISRSVLGLSRTQRSPADPLDQQVDVGVEAMSPSYDTSEDSSYTHYICNYTNYRLNHRVVGAPI